MKEEETLQQMLNKCLRRNIVFDFNGRKCRANLNLTLQYIASLDFEGSDISKEWVDYPSLQDVNFFMKVEKYLKAEGFFDIDHLAVAMR